MKVMTGKVVDGRVIVEGVDLDEGTSVTILANEGEDGFTLAPEDEAELLASIEEADRGETLPAEQVRERLALRYGR